MLEELCAEERAVVEEAILALERITYRNRHVKLGFHIAVDGQIPRLTVLGSASRKMSAFRESGDSRRGNFIYRDYRPGPSRSG